MKRSKYGVRTDKAGIEARTRDNIVFHSKREANRYEDLKLLSVGKLPVVMDLEFQPEWELKVNGVLICKYRADFRYRQFGGYEWSTVVEDCKGFHTPEYKLKKRLMKAIYGIEIKET